MKKISPFFSVQRIIKTHVIPQYTSYYLCHLGRHLVYFTTLKQKSCQSNSPIATTVENYQKKVINCDSDFKWNFALKWRPSWTPS